VIRIPLSPNNLYFNGNESARGALRALEKTFAFQRPANFFGRRAYLTFPKANLRYALDIRKFFAALFQQDDRTTESEPSLEKADLMNYVFSRVLFTIAVFVLAGCNDQREGAFVEHLLKPIRSVDSSRRLTIEFLVRQMQAIDYKVF